MKKLPPLFNCLTDDEGDGTLIFNRLVREMKEVGTLPLRRALIDACQGLLELRKEIECDGE